MKSSEIEAIRDATSDAIDCLFILQGAAVKHKAIKSEATTKRFIETAYRLEGVTNVLAAALCGRFDSFAAVAPALVRFGPLVLASAHEAIHSGCRILVSEIAEGIMEHHFPDWPPRGQETRMPDALVCEADFAVAIDAAVEAYFNAGFSESDMNDLSALLRQEQARAVVQPAANSADTPDNPADKRKKSLPRDPDVIKLARKIKTDLPHGGTKEDIALDFAEGNEKKASRLLKQLQPSRHGYLLD